MPSKNDTKLAQNNVSACSLSTAGTATSNLNSTTGLNALTATSSQSYGWVSGTTTTIINSGLIGSNSIGTAALSNYHYATPKEGELKMNPETSEWSIYLADFGGWINCEVEEIKKELDENGKKTSIISVSFECSVAFLKKKQRERKVMTEKYKEPIIPEPLYTNGYLNFFGNDYNNLVIGGGHNNIAIGINNLYNYTNPLTLTYTNPLIINNTDTNLLSINANDTTTGSLLNSNINISKNIA